MSIQSSLFTLTSRSTAILLVLLNLVQGFTSPAFLYEEQSFLSTPSMPSLRDTETVCFYSNAVDPVTSPSVTDDKGFRNRMKRITTRSKEREQQKLHELELKKERDQPDVEQKENSNGIVEVRTLQEYKEVVADEQNSLVVVRFYAPWCRACRAMEPLYRRLCTWYSSYSTSIDSVDDNRLPVKFVQVPISEQNSLLHQGLGVPSIPYCHIYYPGGELVEELRFTKQHVRHVAQILESYVQGECTDVELDTTSQMYLSPYYIKER